jgi:hypothetical protein
LRPVSRSKPKPRLSLRDLLLGVAQAHPVVTMRDDRP